MGNEGTNNEPSVDFDSNVAAGNILNAENDAILENNETDTIPENGGSAILEDNELEIFGERGQHLIESYLRPGTVFPEHLFKGVTPKLVNILPHNITGNKCWKLKATP